MTSVVIQNNIIAMGTSDIIFYLSLGLGGLALYMLKPSKPKHPTPLKMKNFSPKRSYSKRQLAGAKPVKAEVMSKEDITAVTEVTHIQGASWASPIVFVSGKPMDAFSVLDLPAGAPLNQVRTQVAALLEQKNTATKINLIKRAYQAIVDADKA